MGLDRGSDSGETFIGTATLTAVTLSTMENVAGNVGMTTGGYSNAWMLDKRGITVWGIGGFAAARQEFGSQTVQAASTRAVVPWSFSVDVAEW